MTTEQAIYSALRADGIPDRLALLVVAQSKHESGGYTSRIFKVDNNSFGYKYVGQHLATQGLASPEGDHYAHYSRIEDSAREISAWIKRRQKEGRFPGNLATITTPEQYAQLLKECGYYGDSLANYTHGLISWFKANIKPVGAGAGIIAAAAAILLLKGRK